MSDIQGQPAGLPPTTPVPAGSATPPSPAAPAAIGTAEAKGMKGMFQDPSTLASTGLLVAVLFAIVGGLINILESAGDPDIQTRLLALTGTVDVGDVALLGISVALLLLTPDPPGGVPRPLLLQFSAVLAGVITIFEVIRAIVLIVESGPIIGRTAGLVATLGVAIAAFTVAFYAAKESFLKEAHDEAVAAAGG